MQLSNRVKKRSYINNWVVYILLFLNIISGGISILPLYYVYDSIAVLNLCVGALNFIWIFIHINRKGNIPYLPAFIIFYILIVVYQLFTGWFTFSSTVLFLQASFLILLIKLFGIYKTDTGRILSDVYLAYSFVNVVCTITAVILILTGIIDLTSNPLDLNTFTKSDDLAFFPGHLTVFRPKDVIRTGFIPIEGMICGFSHEPHVAGYLCIPALFIWVDRLRSYKRVIIVLLYALFIILTASTTSLIFVPLVFIIALLINPEKFGKYKIITYSILFLLVVFIILNQAFFLDNFGFFIDKAQDSGDDSSMASSINYIKYALVPSTIIGSNIYGFTGDISHGDVGIFTAIFNLVVYISSFWFALKMIKCKTSIVFWTGLAFMYFLFHSMKGMLLIYQYPYAMLLMFMSFIVYKCNTTYSIVQNNDYIVSKQ